MRTCTHLYVYVHEHEHVYEPMHSVCSVYKYAGMHGHIPVCIEYTVRICIYIYTYVYTFSVYIIPYIYIYTHI